MHRTLLRQTERVVVLGGVALAIVIALSNGQVQSAALARGEAQPSAAARLATVDVLAITERLVGTEKYRSARDTHVTTLNKTLEPLMAEIKDMAARFQTMDQGTPESEALRAQFPDKQQRLRQAEDEARAQIEQFNTTQVTEAYRVVLEAGDAMAAERGYTHLIASRAGPVTIRSTNLAGAVQEILARPVVRGVAGDDLTEALAARLGLEKAAPAAEPVKAVPTDR